MTHAVLFDLDGTLIDSHRDLADAVNHVRSELSLEPLAVAQIVSYIGDGVQALLQRACPQSDQQELASAQGIFTQYYKQHCCVHTDCYPGVRELLEQLQQADMKLAVVTNKPRAFALIILQSLGIDSYFDCVVGGDKERKPDPAPVLEAMRILQVTAEDTWFCGDHHTDLIAGRRAACKTIWCSWGFGQHDDQAFDRQCDKVVEIWDVISGRS